MSMQTPASTLVVTPLSIFVRPASLSIFVRPASRVVVPPPEDEDDPASSVESNSGLGAMVPPQAANAEPKIITAKSARARKLVMHAAQQCVCPMPANELPGKLRRFTRCGCATAQQRRQAMYPRRPRWLA